jgi:hypothetical protein
MLIFCGDELLAYRPSPMLEDHLLSAVRDSCFSTFTDAFHIRTPSPLSATRVRAFSNYAFVIGRTISVPRRSVKSSFISLEVTHNFLLEFQALSDADNCKSKYCPSVAGPRVKQQ